MAGGVPLVRGVGWKSCGWASRRCSWPAGLPQGCWAGVHVLAAAASESCAESRADGWPCGSRAVSGGDARQDLAVPSAPPAGATACIIRGRGCEGVRSCVGVDAASSSSAAPLLPATPALCSLPAAELMRCAGIHVWPLDSQESQGVASSGDAGQALNGPTEGGAAAVSDDRGYDGVSTCVGVAWASSVPAKSGCVERRQSALAASTLGSTAPGATPTCCLSALTWLLVSPSSLSASASPSCSSASSFLSARASARASADGELARPLRCSSLSSTRDTRARSSASSASRLGALATCGARAAWAPSPVAERPVEGGTTAALICRTRLWALPQSSSTLLHAEPASGSALDSVFASASRCSALLADPAACAMCSIKRALCSSIGMLSSVWALCVPMLPSATKPRLGTQWRPPWPEPLLRWLISPWLP
mmetsp:Transcript_88438/g.286373  ORF Transcript_88438/g.286373 Transcript_88438/m.286373 type:complete len:424 (+) Transcript_88438:309-1580(+)